MSLPIAAALFVLALVILGYGLRTKYANRCSQCRRSFVSGTPVRWCVSGHKIHPTCVKYAMNREVCPVCGIYVSDRTAL